MSSEINSKKCIFCESDLEKSLEHIIPDCINGRLTSSRLICHACNGKFGKELEPDVKKLFNSLLLILGVKDPSGVKSTDPSGNEFLHKRTGEVKIIKPELTQIRKDGKTIISVSGDPKNARKLLAKKTAELLKKGRKIVEFSFHELSEAPPLSIAFKFEATDKLILELNKIAVEFYALSGLDISLIQPLAKRIHAIDLNLNNIIFCNQKSEVREFGTREISHLIALKTDAEGALFCYIELFNVVCAYIKLVDKFEGEADYIYHQDAITGEKLKDTIQLDLSKIPKNEDERESFDILINSLFERLRERNFHEVSLDIYAAIKLQTEQDVKNGNLRKEDFEQTCFERCLKALAELSVADFPYMIEDFKDEENHEINHIHSNMPNVVYPKFCEVNQHIVGLRVQFPSEGDFEVVGFLDQPFLKRGKVSLVKVYCVLQHTETLRKKYIPYRDFLMGITSIENQM